VSVTDPHQYSASEIAKDGLAFTVRALHADDRDRITAAIRGLDRQSIYLRLFSYRGELTEQGLDRVMRFDPATEIVLLATLGARPDETVIGSARYVVTRPGVAEVAFVVEEDYAGRGIGGRLLRHLGLVAREQGLESFEAEVLPENKAMQAVFRRTGWQVESRRADGVVHVTMRLPRDLA
jgi:RimJ/RimL family protein N-acetyltransferase